MWPNNSTTSGYSCFTGQTLTCGSIKNDSSARLGAIAQVQFAVNGPGEWTTVRTCELSVSYVKPIINTFIGEYIQATTEQSTASSLQTPQGLTPTQLVLLSIAGPMKLFHDGPPPLAANLTPVTDVFRWIGWLNDDGKNALTTGSNQDIIFHNPSGDTITPTATYQITATDVDQSLSSMLSEQGIALTMASANESLTYTSDNAVCPYFGGSTSNPWDMLQYRPKPGEEGVIWVIPFSDWQPDHDGNVQYYRPSSINKDIFLKPLASIISSPGFFANGTTTGVAFETDLILVHGKVSSVLAMVVLMLPILWTFVLSLVSNSTSRWTASLDPFAMFRLGGDWRPNLKQLRLASLSEARTELAEIPGTIRVNHQESFVELAHSPGEVCSRHRKPRREVEQTLG